MKSIINKIYAALEQGQYKVEENTNLQDNSYCIWPSGQWEERCTNEYGSSFFTGISGKIDLTEEEKEFCDQSGTLLFDEEQ